LKWRWNQNNGIYWKCTENTGYTKYTEDTEDTENTRTYYVYWIDDTSQTTIPRMSCLCVNSFRKVQCMICMVQMFICSFLVIIRPFWTILFNSFWLVLHGFSKLCCIRILTRNYGINYIDQCITKQMLYVYSMDTCSIRYCNNTTIKSTCFKIQQTVWWTHECLVNVSMLTSVKVFICFACWQYNE